MIILRMGSAVATFIALIMGCGMPPTSESRSIAYEQTHVGVYEVQTSRDLVPLPDRRYYLNVNFNLRSDDNQTDVEALTAAINKLRLPSKQKDINQARNNHPVTFCAIKIYRDKKGNELGHFSSGIIITIDEICSELAAQVIVSETMLFPSPKTPNASTGGWSEVMILQHSIGDEQRDHTAIEPTDENEER